MTQINICKLLEQRKDTFWLLQLMKLLRTKVKLKISLQNFSFFFVLMKAFRVAFKTVVKPLNSTILISLQSLTVQQCLWAKKKKLRREKTTDEKQRELFFFSKLVKVLSIYDYLTEEKCLWHIHISPRWSRPPSLHKGPSVQKSCFHAVCAQQKCGGQRMCALHEDWWNVKHPWELCHPAISAPGHSNVLWTCVRHRKCNMRRRSHTCQPHMCEHIQLRRQLS